MLIFGIILTCLTGILLTGIVGTRFSWAERIGLSFPLGMTLQTIVMALLDLMHIPLTATSVLAAEAIVFALLLFIVIRYRGIDSLRFTPAMLDDWKQANLVWILLLFLIGYCEYMNFSKCIFFPPSDRDSLAAFDTLGFVAAHDHTYMRMSLFEADYNPSIHQAGGSIAYSPFVQMSYAYVYLLGAETSKAIPALMYLFFVVAFYAILRRNTGKTVAALATLFMMMTPEMLGFSSLSGTNVMQAIFVGLGIAYTASWFRNRHDHDLYAGALLLGANMWCRNEGIVFIGAACVVLLIDCIRRKSYRKGLYFTGVALIPAVIWFIYMKIGGLYTEGMAITHLFWDGEKAGNIVNGFWTLFNNTLYYGWTFVVFAIFLLGNIWFTIKKRDNLALLGMIVLSVVFYGLVIYHVDYVWDSIQNVLAYSAKRFFFCYAPLCWYYAATTQIARKGSDYIENLLSLK
ncbi:MAG TPA: glycosyltransferase family 39 protein [Candidatus Barnesiella excrementigallinarum]|nr:glycosyltransferase family 39 protein [Candidatus Barnesiella excrementigallinarum]